MGQEVIHTQIILVHQPIYCRVFDQYEIDMDTVKKRESVFSKAGHTEALEQFYLFKTYNPAHQMEENENVGYRELELWDVMYNSGQ